MLRKKNNSSNKTYPHIDMERTGLHLKEMLGTAGYTPKMVQEYLNLSCPQPVYRWYKGKILPSVDNLLMLSELLDVHMEELIVRNKKMNEFRAKKSNEVVLTVEIAENVNAQKRLQSWLQLFSKRSRRE